MEYVFFDQFVALCKDKGVSPNFVAKEIGASSGSVTAWKQGVLPRSATLTKLAEYFDVSTDYLLGKADQKKTALSEPELTEDELRILSAFREMSPERQKALADLLGISDS